MHWTYTSFQPNDHLQQGDILHPTPELKRALQAIHPYFCDAKYIGFLALTQTCDLVFRDGDCTTPYIALAAVREIDDVVPGLLARTCSQVANKVYLKDTKTAASQLLRRIFNQNESGLGLFYLHPDVDAGIAVPAVATLRVAFTLKSVHYGMLREARRGRLGTAFEAKLGWMVGHIYSRVGVPDWSEPAEREEDLKRMVKEILEPANEDAGPVWVQSRLVKRAKQNNVDLSELTPTEVKQRLEQFTSSDPASIIATEVESIVKNVIPTIAPAEVEKIVNRLKNSDRFRGAIKQAAEEASPSSV